MCEICFVTGVLLKIDSEALETKRSDLPQKCHLHCALTGDWMKKLLNAAAIVTKSVQARQYLAEKYEKSLDNTTSRVATQAKCRFQVLHGQPSAGSAWNLRCCFGSLFDEGLHEKICIQASFWTKNHTDTCACSPWSDSPTARDANKLYILWCVVDAYLNWGRQPALELHFPRVWVQFSAGSGLAHWREVQLLFVSSVTLCGLLTAHVSTQAMVG